MLIIHIHVDGTVSWKMKIFQNQTTMTLKIRIDYDKSKRKPLNNWLSSY